ncbi:MULTISPECIES: CobW family GTP-binding protein [Fischerella]|uniref:GTP-binding protein n=1 Tax=Fischerella muscicola CCMEE 5323 TaxID=2019572 RepID=A0A2N6JX05_FISMU|nr:MULTISPECIES: GTP-binding protein [Fischerella]MBD2432237.1 GTP-binding protein [Fischerella sp. FACHB-380]PLZ84772.1 GTP-binding protein [Fischerella muscicola CCMEE 5323]
MTQFTAPNANTIADIPKRGMPVTIITGFLGSGKTTLLNQILKNKQDLKVAVLVNEFGDINIDSQLLVSIDEDMLELSNGCICCTINDGLVDAVYRVLEREERIDYLVIETTGVADPLPIILTFLGTELRDLTHLDSILTLVDSETFNHEHFLSEAALKQLTYGDIVLLNKTDLVTQEKLEELEAYIREVKVGAKILHTTYGQVPLPLILGVDLTPKDEYYSLIEDKHEHNHTHEHHHHHHHGHHSHHLENDGFISVSFQSDRPFDVHKFENFLNEEIPQDVFRAKGILWFSDSNLRHIFQLSGPRYSLNGDEWLTPPKNQLVFIGRNLDANEINSLLNQCLA